MVHSKDLLVHLSAVGSAVGLAVLTVDQLGSMVEQLELSKAGYLVVYLVVYLVAQKVVYLVVYLVVQKVVYLVVYLVVLMGHSKVLS